MKEIRVGVIDRNLPTLPWWSYNPESYSICSGYICDIYKELQRVEYLRFNIILEGDWDGLGKRSWLVQYWIVTCSLVQGLHNHEIDLAMTSLTITSRRLELIDYSIEIFKDEQWIIAKRQSNDDNIFSFISPFNMALWIGTIVAFLLMCALIIFIRNCSQKNHDSFFDFIFIRRKSRLLRIINFQFIVCWLCFQNKFHQNNSSIMGSVCIPHDSLL